MSPQLRSQASQNGREAWGCPHVMWGPLGRTLLEFHCNLCPGTALTGNQVSLLVPMKEHPSDLPACPPCSRAPVPFIELLSLSLPLPRLSSQALTSVLVMFPSSVDYISHHPMSSFPRTLSEYMANQPP